MAGKASPRVSLNKRERELLEEHSNRGKIGIRMWRRIQSILRGARGESNYSISKDIDYGVESIAQWRKRWESKYPQLQKFALGASEKGVSNKELLSKMLEILSDKPRSGTPPTFSLAQKKQIVAISCKKPKDYGIIKESWTYDDIAQVAQEQGVVESITGRYVNMILKK